MDAQGPIFLDAELRPNRSLSKNGFMALMLAVSALLAVPTAVFMAMGAWPVAGFLGLDIVALYVAFRVSYAQGRAREFVRVTNERLDISRHDQYGRQTGQATFPSYWASVHMDDPPEPDSPLTISASGRTVVVGGFLSAPERLSLAQALRDALAEARRS
jgi:uncharacterized membrane protein